LEASERLAARQAGGMRRGEVCQALVETTGRLGVACAASAGSGVDRGASPRRCDVVRVHRTW
jgi:hypothetical protein